MVSLFARKIKGNSAGQSPQYLEHQYEEIVTKMEVVQVLVEFLLLVQVTLRTIGLDDLSPHLLNQCAHELGAPLTTVFSVFFQENT